MSASPSSSSIIATLPAEPCSFEHKPVAAAVVQEELRKNEHLAIAIPRHNWKPDSSSLTCDNLPCRVRFTLLERRHHCRMCGGVFCAACTSQSTALLDSSDLTFHLAPRGVSVWHFQSQQSPVAVLRVCDGCHDIVHGIVTRPPVKDPKLFEPTRTRRIPVSPSSSLSSSSLATPPDSRILSGRISRRPSSSTSSSANVPLPTKTKAIPKRTRTLSNNTSNFSSPRVSPRTRARQLPSLITTKDGRPPTVAELAPEYATLSLGELDAYPLRVPSAICKATGGGRWHPKTVYQPSYPVGKPGTPDFLRKPEDPELVARRKREENAVIVDGEFQYRLPGPPKVPARRWPVESTF